MDDREPQGGEELPLSEQPARFRAEDPAELDRLSTETVRAEAEQPPER